MGKLPVVPQSCGYNELGAAELIGHRAKGSGYLLTDRVTDLDKFVAPSGALPESAPPRIQRS